MLLVVLVPVLFGLESIRADDDTHATMKAAPSALGQGQASSIEACVRGTTKAPVRIEVFSDYQCPACRAFYLLTMKLVFTNYADAGAVCVVYRDYPGFPHSREAAKYARAAMRVGPRQWGVVADAIFELQPEWAQSGDLHAVVAGALDGKDMDAVRSYLEDPALDDLIDADALLGLEMQVTSTPTFFIISEGRRDKVEAAITYAAMQQRLDALLRGKRTLAHAASAAETQAAARGE
jgi:protein-disulfide isomerase